MDTPKTNDCPSPDRLRGLLSGELPAIEQDSVTRHIETCPSCQHTLDGWLKSPSIEGLAAAAKGSATQEAALRDLMADVKKKSVGDVTQADTSAANDEDLGYLQPSDKPGSLGRLGHYEILEIIGKGGFGIVLKAFDEKLHRIVAIKVLSPALSSSGTARKRFTREAQAAAAVSHDHVVAIHAVEDEHNPPYIVMQCIEGMSLQDKLDKQGPLGLKETLRIGFQAAEGLAAAHKQGLVHRDIKPGNILLENGVERVKITDFGLARAVDDASITQSGVVAGTPAYMSPEQAEGIQIDHRSDLFSLGTVLYVMCTGRPPFRASGTMAILKRVCEETPRPIREINPETPAWLADIITKLHAKDRKERYQTAREVADVLSQRLALLQQPLNASGPHDFRGVSVPLAQPQEQASRPQHEPRPRRKPVAGVLALLSLLVVAGIGIYWLNRPPVTVVLPPGPGPERVQPEPDNGWVQLFNGNDLTGWRTSRPQNWKVENGLVVGEGGHAILESNKDFQNFHCRIEAKTNGKGLTAFIFRGLRGKNGQVRLGFRELENQTGRLARYDAANTELLHPSKAKSVPPDTWFSLELIVQQKKVVIKVDETVTADMTVEQLPDSGKFAFNMLPTEPGLVLQVRKIEIKELPPTPPVPKDEWVQLFNGKDLTEWKTAPGNATSWGVTDGAIVGRDGKGHLIHETMKYENFHLRLEAKYEPQADGGVLFRRPEKMDAQEKVPEVQIADKNRLKTTTGRLTEWGPNGPEDTRPNEWFNLEVIANGAHIITTINGKTCIDLVDERIPIRPGRLGLQCWSTSAVYYRKIEIKELPPTPEAEKPRVLAKFGPAEPPLEKVGVTAEDGGWKIVSDGPRVITLWKLDQLSLPPGKLTAKYQARTSGMEGKGGVHFVTQYANMESKISEGSRYEIGQQVEWKTHTRTWYHPFPEHPLEMVELRLTIPGKGVLWLREMEVIHTPLPFDQRVELTGQPRWQVRSRGTLPAHFQAIESIAFARERRLLITSAPVGNKVRFWSADDGGWKQIAELALNATVTGVACTQDGNLLATGQPGKLMLYRWDGQTWKSGATFPHLSGQTQLAISPDETRLVATSASYTAAKASGATTTWDLRTEKELPPLQHDPTTRCWQVAFSPRGDWLAMPVEGVGTQVWDLKAEKGPITLPSEGGRCAAFSPDGVTLATGGAGKAALWFLEAGQWRKKFALDGHAKSFVRLTAFTAGGKVLATGDQAGVIKLWEVSSGQVLATLHGHYGQIWSIIATGDNTLASAGMDGVVRFWEVTPLPEDKAGPFVVLAKANRAETRHPTLAAAVAATQSGDTIEIQGNGPFMTEPIKLDAKALAIRAGAGFRPVVQLDPAFRDDGNHLIGTRAPLILEGLELRSDSTAKKTPYLLQGFPETSSFIVRYCRLVSSGDGIGASFSSRVEIRNSDLISKRGSAVHWALPARGKLLIEHSVVRGGRALGLHAYSRTPEEHLLDVKNSTLLGRVTALGLGWGQPDTKPIELKALPSFVVDAADSVIHGKDGFARLVNNDDKADAKELTDFLGVWKWKPGVSLLGPARPFLLHNDKPFPVNKPARFPEDWKAFWNADSIPGIVGEPRFQGGDLFSLTPEAWSALPVADFRLAKGSPGQGVLPGGKDLGADVDLVGPGEPYERWQKTPAYQEWRKQTDELMAKAAGETQPFVVLAKTNRAETRHPTLAAAVAAAQSGDTIEIQGNGPFVVEPLKIREPIRIVAAAGQRPVLRMDPAHEDNAFWFDLRSTLTLEGLELVRRGGKVKNGEFATIIAGVNDLKGKCRLRNCRLLVEHQGAAMIIASLDMANCEIYSQRPFNEFFTNWPGGWTVANNVCATDGAVTAMTTRGKEWILLGNLNFDSNTFVSRSFLTINNHKGWSTPVTKRDSSPLPILTARNVISTKVDHFVRWVQTLESENGKDWLAEAEQDARQLLDWSGRHNLFPISEFLSIAKDYSPAPKGKTGLTLRDWQKRAKFTDSDSVQGEAIFSGGDLLERHRAKPGSLTPADFRLAKGSPGQGVLPGGKDLGADVDLVGPGAAYERWKKTLEYEEWRKQTGALMAAAAGPFVIVAKDKRGETRHATLADAAKAAQSGDTIEIRGDGPFVTEPIDLGKRALTLRAGAGCLPVLQLDSTKTKAWASAMLESRGPLVLEGLEFHYLDELNVPTYLVRAYGPLRVANCRFKSNTKAHVITDDSPSADLSNCQFFSKGSCVTRHLRTGGRLSIDNCVLSSTGAALRLEEYYGKIEDVVIRLQHTTTMGSIVPLDVRFNNPDKLDEYKPLKPPIHVETVSSVYAGKYAFGGVSFFKATPEPEESARRLLRRFFQWAEQQNVYQNTPDFFNVGIVEMGKTKGHKRLFQGLKDWREFWKITESKGVAGDPVFHGGDLFARLDKDPWSLQPSDFRLAKGSPGQGVLPGGKDLGADVDLVGPGEPYERWQKTPAYQEWRKKTEELMSAK